jgi:hypothetical protein
MQSKYFTIAGTSILNGCLTTRIATGTIMRRVAVLRRNNHTNIILRELPFPMTRQDAINFVQEQPIRTAMCFNID